MKDKLFKLTPLGRADVEMKKYFEEDKDFRDSKEFKDYEASRKKYRNRKMFQLSIKVLLYASVITSIAVSLGIPYLRIINRIASYLGLTVILVLYVIALYITSLYKEEYHLKREILISKNR